MTSSLSFAEYWLDDFRPLTDAARLINDALRADEQAPSADLYRRLTQATSTTTNGGSSGSSSSGGVPTTSHLYFAETNTTRRLRHQQTIPLPALLQEELPRAQSHALMGLLAPAQLAWMSVDAQVFLWSWCSHEIACSFAVPSGQAVVAVGLVRPKPGVFKAEACIEWCVIITTPDEVMLCALAQPPTDESSWQLVATHFVMPTDGVPMLCVAGTRGVSGWNSTAPSSSVGRIFLGGADGCVYEMEYGGATMADKSRRRRYAHWQQELDAFYDGDDSDVRETIVVEDYDYGSNASLGKRAWDAVRGHNSSQAIPSSKCRKINRSSTASSFFTALVPDVVTTVGSYVIASATHNSMSGGKITSMVIDEERQCLYTLGSTKGWVCAFDIASTRSRTASTTTTTEQQQATFCAALDVPKVARLYLEAVSRGQSLPPRTTGSAAGSIAFPGGGAAAQAGVGGMEGARMLLQQLDGRVGSSSHIARRDLLVPVSIHVVPRRESARLTLVVVTKGGLRLYVTSLSKSTLGSSNNSNMDSRALAPSSQLTLCHIRAPPPTSLENMREASLVETGIVGGVSPRASNAPEKLPNVDASIYHDGDLLLTAHHRAAMSSRGSNATPAFAGDRLVAVGPDLTTKKMETDENVRRPAVPSYTNLGGVVESVSFALESSAFGSHGSSGATLPGGIVWDVACVTDCDNSTVAMTTASTTPTDNELGVGMPPPFYPVSGESRSLGSTSVDNPAGRSLVASSGASLSSTALSILGKVLSNALLARPLRHGFASAQGSAMDDYLHSQQAKYRLAVREDGLGFSQTAMERRVVSNTTATITAKTKSVRLRQWLIKPAVVPLGQSSLNHLSRTKQYVTLNTGGVHIFEFDTVVTRFADALVMAGENVRNDANVSSFFTCYGFKEGCALCFALAAGSNKAMIGNTDIIRRRAVDAALYHASRPQLVLKTSEPQSFNSSMVTSTRPSVDPFVPLGHEFKPSAICDGLIAVFSRMMRPIWHKPVVVVTEGRFVKHFYGTSKQTPAKVEVLLDGTLLSDIAGPLLRLQRIIRDFFTPAVKTVPGAQRSFGSPMDMDDDDGGDLTRSLDFQSRLRAKDGTAVPHLSASEAANLAQLIEEKNINCLYRLLGRVTQLTSLVDLLRRAQGMAELREVDWGLLHGLTTAQLVVSSEGQDRLESLLNALVTGSTSLGFASEPKISAQADQLAQDFAQRCYFFFSPASRFAYLGLREAAEAMRAPLNSTQRSAAALQAANHFRLAARHWHSVTLVTGRTLHSKDSESASQIARKAMERGSPLARVVEALIRLTDVASAVEVCLIAANNFRGRTFQGTRLIDQFETGLAAGDAFDWEQSLYHTRKSGLDIAARNADRVHPSEALATGIEVTAKDAVDACYSLVFYHLEILLRSSKDLADYMVKACVSSRDSVFLDALFQFLLENDQSTLLLRIESQDLDHWLHERNDPDLLWRYYTVQGENGKAGQISFERAIDDETRIPLDERIDCLTRALNAYRAANNRIQSPVSFDQEHSYEIQEVEQKLRVAQIQARMLNALQCNAGSESLDSADDLDNLKSSLASVSELYNDFAAPNGLYEFCLLILHACQHEDAGPVRRLWKTILCNDILPCATRHRDTYETLLRFAEDLSLGDSVHLLGDYDDAGDLKTFEQGSWAVAVESKISELGRELYGTGADFVFPVDFLLFNLVFLQGAAQESVPPEWPLLTLARVGVPFMVLLEAYNRLLQQNRQCEPGWRQGGPVAEIALLHCWLDTVRAAGGTASELARDELVQASVSGRLEEAIDAIRVKLASLSNSQLVSRLRAFEDALQYSL